MKKSAMFFRWAVMVISLALWISPVYSGEELKKGGSEVKPETKEEFEKGMEKFGEKDKTPPVSINIGEEKHAIKAGYGGWLAPMPMLFLTNLDGLNAVPHLTDEMFLMGGRAYGVIGGNFRIGGMGAGMEKIKEGSSGEVERSTGFSIGFGGLTMEYQHDFERFELSIGALLGAGGVSVRRYVNSVLIEPPGKESGAFFAGEPFVTVKYCIQKWFGIEASAGYLWAQVPSGTLEGVSDSNFSGFIFSIAPTFGYTTGKEF